MVRKFHVEYDLETVVDPSEWHDSGHEYLYSVPDDAVITEIRPKIEAGWYMYGGVADAMCFWSAEELEEMDLSDFLEDRVRMNPPTPYKEGKYPDGAYRMSDGFSYLRQGGVWYLHAHGGWLLSAYSDETIEDDEAIKMHPQDYLARYPFVEFFEDRTP